MNGPNVLEARALGKRYGDQWALRDCTLALPAGRVVGLVGPNGAGKTTLLQLAVGVLAPSAGQIAVFGRDPRETTSVLPRLGFVAQDSPLYRSLTVGETLAVGRHLNARFDEQWARERLRELKVPLERKVGELSGGQRAQVALAAVALIVLLLALTGEHMHSVFRGSGLGHCLATRSHSDCGGLESAFESRFSTLRQLVPFFMALPALLGIFWGAPLVAREVEQGTHLFVWTQGISRVRWLGSKLLALVGLTMLMTAAYAVLIS